MAKLVLLAFTIATLLAFASAHRTIITTTIEDDINPSQKREHCSQHLQGQQFRQCQTYLQQPEWSPYGQQPEQTPYSQQHPQQQQTLQQCCNELRNVDQMCVCKAVKKIFGDVQQQYQQHQQQETGPFGSQEIQQVKQRAQNLPNICNIQTRKQCNIRNGQECRQEVQGRQFNRCQRYLEQQTGSGYGYLRSAVSNQRQPEELEQCCEELRNVDMQCQCDAMKEVYSQAQEEHRPTEMGELRRIVEDLKNQCNLPVGQCQIPSGMF